MNLKIQSRIYSSAYALILPVQFSICIMLSRIPGAKRAYKFWLTVTQMHGDSLGLALCPNVSFCAVLSINNCVAFAALTSALTTAAWFSPCQTWDGPRKPQCVLKFTAEAIRVYWQAASIGLAGTSSMIFNIMMSSNSCLAPCCRRQHSSSTALQPTNDDV